MITLKISQIINSTEVLRKLSGEKFKAKLSWAITRILKAADNEIKEFNDTRYELIQKYGEKDENGNLITDDQGNVKINANGIADFSNQLNELLDTTVEINANKIKMSDLENVDFTPDDMIVLEPYIDFEEEEE